MKDYFYISVFTEIQDTRYGKKKNPYERQEDRKWGSFALTENKRCIEQIKETVRKRDILLLAFKRLSVIR